MRYFVVVTPDLPDIPAYVMAEVVRDVPIDQRAYSFASSLAGARARILTRMELVKTPAGRTALEAWEARDDSSFELENFELMSGESTDIDVTYLRVVKTDTDGGRLGPYVPTNERHREIYMRSRALRAAARALLERSVEQRRRPPTKTEGNVRSIV